MGMLDALVATRKRAFNLLKGTNQLATIDDVNKAFDAINVLAKNSNQVLRFDFELNMDGSNVVGSNAQRASGAGPWDICSGSGTDCGSATNQAYKKTGAIIHIDFKSTGVYDISIFSGDDKTKALFSNATISLGTLGLPGVSKLVKTDLFTYRLTVVDNAGVALANVFDNTLLTVNLYPDKTKNSWNSI